MSGTLKLFIPAEEGSHARHRHPDREHEPARTGDRSLDEAARCLEEARNSLGSARTWHSRMNDVIYAEAVVALESGDLTRAIGVLGGLNRWEVEPLAQALLAEAMAGAGDADGAEKTARWLQSWQGFPGFTGLIPWTQALARKAAGKAAAARLERAACLAGENGQAALAEGVAALEEFERLGSASRAARVRR